MAAMQPHARRPPAHRSVSLVQKRRKSPRESSSSGENAGDSDPNSNRSNSPSSLQPLGRESSGESSTKSADRWFDNKNDDVGGNTASFTDGEPPFFLRNNSSNSQTPPDAQQQQIQAQNPAMHADSLQHRMGLVRMGTDGSSTEDYRGVIDDLTIENKKLKKRLKKYEKLHDAHLRDEKLFEVRFHGLPPDKKSELEETLQKFAASLGSNRFPSGYEGLMPSLMDKNASPAPHTDSAYASNSASGPGSSSRSAGEARSGVSGGQTARREQNIQSYLHHIPEGLLPQTNPSNMTERAKQKLVVRRLEQIFAGKGAALHGHHQPIQQQELAQMAARADKAQNLYPGRQEGIREAHIMTEDGEAQADLADQTAAKEHVSFSPSVNKENKSPDLPSAQHPEREQRPTRPLDLDPHRAQVPSENIRYIRHLGFSPSDQQSPQDMEDGRGWVYLNLLINMAQLHTLNVTTEFVRKAVATRSSRFEVSSDGRKVRWKGGSSVTRTSSQGGVSITSHLGFDTPDGGSPPKRPKLSHRESHRSQASVAESKLLYTPMFWNRSSTDGDEYTSEEDDNVSTPGQAPMAGDSSGMTSSGMRISAPRKRRRDDGPMIFYNNVRFCTDLSGDPGAQYVRNPPLYAPAAEVAIGESQASVPGKMAEKRGPLASASELPLAMDLNDNPIPESMEISFPPPCDVAETTEKKQPVDLEVSGIGGVWPADHFTIEVESRRVQHDQGVKPKPTHRHYLSTRLAKLLPGASPSAPSLPGVKEQIVKSSQKDLPPSELPPALCFMAQSDDYGSDIEEDDALYTSPISESGSVPEAAPQPVQLHYVGSDGEEDEYDDEMDDDESDGSVDMLAAARELDPEAIRLREREYDANMAERLAEEIPAGSSAATAGGGSGFASPAHGVSRDEYQAALAQHRRGVLRRSGTADSMKVLVQGARESSSDTEDEEMEDAGSVAS